MSSADPSQNLTRNLLIDSLCDEFESHLGSTSPTLLREYLQRAPTDDRPALFRELMAMEIEWRIEKNGSLDADQWKQTFPEYQAAIDDLVREMAPALAYPVFRQQLLESGLIEPEQLDAIEKETTLPESGRAQAIAATLVERRLLTAYQADRLVHGRGKRLILGDYLVLEPLGAGGMGLVFLGVHRRLDRQVAIKMLPEHRAGSRSASRRFLREGRTSASLQHPNIVMTLDAGECDGVEYLVMERVDGQDLSAVVKEQGPMSAGVAVDVIVQAARGLAHAHSRGVIHRDLKPSNLILSSDGVVKVLDMGLARFRQQQAQTASITHGGQVLGSPEYLPPEQADDATSADQRSDIYSLGCTLFALMNGRPPFRGDSILATLRAHRDSPVPPLGPGAPPKLDAVYQRMVAKDPNDRFGSMEEVCTQLLNALTDDEKEESLTVIMPPVPQPVAGPSGQAPARARRPLMPVAIVLLLLIAAGAVAWITWPKSKADPPPVPPGGEPPVGRFGLVDDESFADIVAAYHLTLKGKEAFLAGRYDEALKIDLEAVRMQPDWPRYQHNVANTLWKLNRYEEAEPYYRRAAELHPMNGWHHADLAGALLKLNRREEALVPARRAVELQVTGHWTLKELDLQPTEAARLLAEATSRQATDEEEAIRLLKRAHELAPQSPAILEKYAFLLARQSGSKTRMTQAMQLYEEAAQADPYSIARFNLGALHAKQSQWAKARDAYTKALRMWPTKADYYIELSAAADHLGEHDLGELAARRAIALTPQDPEAHNQLGNALYAVKRYADAVASYEEAVELGASSGPRAAHFRGNLAGALLRNGDRERAMTVGIEARALGLSDHWVLGELPPEGKPVDPDISPEKPTSDGGKPTGD